MKPQPERIEITCPEQLRDWLAAHHEDAEAAWVITYKKHCGDRYVSTGEVVAELLCFGWIDCRSKRVDDDRTSLLITHRRPGSGWSAVNKRHVAALVASGRLQPSGLAVIEQAKADGSWTLLDDIEALIEPPDLRAALDARPEARATYDAFGDSKKKRILWWLKSAKRAATRQTRLERVVEATEAGRFPLD